MGDRDGFESCSSPQGRITDGIGESREKANLVYEKQFILQ